MATLLADKRFSWLKFLEDFESVKAFGVMLNSVSPQQDAYRGDSPQPAGRRPIPGRNSCSFEQNLFSDAHGSARSSSRDEQRDLGQPHDRLQPVLHLPSGEDRCALSRPLYRTSLDTSGHRRGGLALNLVLYFTAVSRLDRFTQVGEGAGLGQPRQAPGPRSEGPGGPRPASRASRTTGRSWSDLAERSCSPRASGWWRCRMLLRGFADARRLQIGQIGYSYTFCPRRIGPGRHSYLRSDIGMPVTGPYPGYQGLHEGHPGQPRSSSLSTSVNLTQSAQGARPSRANLTITTYFVATART